LPNVENRISTIASAEATFLSLSTFLCPTGWAQTQNAKETQFTKRKTHKITKHKQKTSQRQKQQATTTLPNKNSNDSNNSKSSSSTTTTTSSSQKR
jgi:hypothetical protein